MPKVFIINATQHDYSKATRFGELVYVTGGFVDLENVTELYKDIISKLDLGAEEDFILLSGPILVNVLAIIYILSYKGTIHKILQWHDNIEDYKVIDTEEHNRIFEESLYKQLNNL